MGMEMEMGLWVELRTPMQIQNPPPRVVCLLLLRLWCPDYLHRGTWALFVYLFAGWPASPLILTSRSTDFYGPHDMERCNMLKATRSACFGHAAQIFHMDKLFPLLLLWFSTISHFLLPIRGSKLCGTLKLAEIKAGWVETLVLVLGSYREVKKKYMFFDFLS